MRFKCGETEAEAAARRKRAEDAHEKLFNWHSFYPWWPRQVTPGDCRCFEWIERRRQEVDYGDSYGEIWEYRAI